MERQSEDSRGLREGNEERPDASPKTRELSVNIKELQKDVRELSSHLKEIKNVIKQLLKDKSNKIPGIE